jgi:hypothetical protein
MKKVGIISSSDFMGSYSTGKGFKVKVLTTDTSKPDKYTHLKSLRHIKNLAPLPLHVTNKIQLKKFVKGCAIVVDGGAPSQLDVQYPKMELFDPATDVAKNFIELIYKTPNIEKVIFIALDAVYKTNFPLRGCGESPQNCFDENDILFISEESHPYAQAKIVTNQPTKKFIVDYPTINFEITTVTPVLIMGKSLSNKEYSTLTGLQYLLKKKLDPNPFVQTVYDNNAEFAIVDVKHAANAIYSASAKKRMGTDGVWGAWKELFITQ